MDAIVAIYSMSSKCVCLVCVCSALLALNSRHDLDDDCFETLAQKSCGDWHLADIAKYRK